MLLSFIRLLQARDIVYSALLQTGSAHPDGGVCFGVCVEGKTWSVSGASSLICSDMNAVRSEMHKIHTDFSYNDRKQGFMSLSCIDTTMIVHPYQNVLVIFLHFRWEM